MSFSLQTRKLLVQAGWGEGRRINTKPYELALQKKGFLIFPALTQFLEQFGGLSFRNAAAVPPASEDWHFRVEEAVAHTNRNNVAAYSEIVGSTLSVIGEASRGHLLLMMDASGRVFAGYDDVFLVVGSSGEDAIESLCSGRKRHPVVPEDPES